MFVLQVSGGARNEVTQRETKMDGLSVRLCEVGARGRQRDRVKPGEAKGCAGRDAK